MPCLYAQSERLSFLILLTWVGKFEFVADLITRKPPVRVVAIFLRKCTKKTMFSVQLSSSKYSDVYFSDHTSENSSLELKEMQMPPHLS